jgi:hypothetical protein
LRRPIARPCRVRARARHFFGFRSTVPSGLMTSGSSASPGPYLAINSRASGSVAGRGDGAGVRFGGESSPGG